MPTSYSLKRILPNMYIKDLIPLHNRLRKTAIVDEFVSRIRDGRTFRGMEKLITISRIKHRTWTREGRIDYKYYIHDGHHRIYSLYKCGVKELMPCEYVLQDMSYEMYEDLAPQNGWVTPINIRIHVRKPDFYQFKNEVLFKYNHNLVFKEYVENHIDMYQEDRTVWHIKDMTYVGI